MKLLSLFSALVPLAMVAHASQVEVEEQPPGFGYQMTVSEFSRNTRCRSDRDCEFVLDLCRCNILPFNERLVSPRVLRGFNRRSNTHDNMCARRHRCDELQRRSRGMRADCHRGTCRVTRGGHGGPGGHGPGGHGPGGHGPGGHGPGGHHLSNMEESEQHLVKRDTMEDVAQVEELGPIENDPPQVLEQKIRIKENQLKALKQRSDRIANELMKNGKTLIGLKVSHLLGNLSEAQNKERLALLEKTKKMFTRWMELQKVRLAHLRDLMKLNLQKMLGAAVGSTKALFNELDQNVLAEEEQAIEASINMLTGIFNELL